MKQSVYTILSCFKLVVGFFLIIKKRNIPFQYIGIVNILCFIRNFFNIYIDKNIFKFLKNIVIDRKMKFSTGLSNFYNDLFLVLLLKKNFSWIRFNYSFINNTKGIMKFIYSFISNLNQDALLLFLFSNLFKKRKLNIRELTMFSCTKKVVFDFLVETNSKFNLLSLTGIEKSKIIFKKYLNLTFKTESTDLSFFYYFYKKQKRFNACIKIADRIKNKKKICIELKKIVYQKKFYYYFTNCLFFGITFLFGSGLFFKKNTSYIFKKYMLTKWTLNIFYLEIFLKEIAFVNLSTRTLDSSKTQVKQFCFPISNMKKIFLNIKTFPHKFNKNKIELYNFCYVLICFSTFVGPNIHFLSKNHLFSFFQKFLGFLYHTPYKFVKNKSYFFNLDSIFFYNNTYTFGFIFKLIQKINFRYMYKKENIFFLKNNLDEGSLLLFVSNFSISIYSEKIKNLIFSSMNFYIVLLSKFQKNVQVWKNIKFLTFSLYILIEKRNNFLNKKESKLQKNLFEFIFSFFNIYENFLKNSLMPIMINFTIDFIIYTKKKILEFFFFSFFQSGSICSKNQNTFYIKKIISVMSKIQLEFFFCYKNKNLSNLLIFSFLNSFETLGFNSIKVINSLEKIPEKKFQKICNLSAFFINTHCVKLLSTIIKEYKKYEKIVFLKIQRNLILKNSKIYIYKNFRIHRSIDEYEFEKTFTICKKYIEIAILQMSVIMRNSVFSKMAIRIYNCFLLCHDMKIKTLVVLSFGIFSISNPSEKIYNFISKFINHTEWNVVKNTILSIGLTGITSKNAKIHVLLKSLANYYCNKIRFLGREKVSDKLNFNITILKLKNIITSIRISQTLTKISLAKNFAMSFSSKIENNLVKYNMLLYTVYTFSLSKYFECYSMAPLFYFLVTIIRANILFSVDEKICVKPFKLKKNKKIYTIFPNLKFKCNKIISFNFIEDFVLI